jgi:hypothetical protein
MAAGEAPSTSLEVGNTMSVCLGAGENQENLHRNGQLRTELDVASGQPFGAIFRGQVAQEGAELTILRWITYQKTADICK